MQTAAQKVTLKRANILAFALAFLTVESARAQTPTLPLKKRAAFPKGLSRGGRLDKLRKLKKGDEQAKKKEQLEEQRKRPQPAPPPSDDDGKPGFAQIKAAGGRRCKTTKGKVLFEFKGADIKDIVEQISKHTCKNFILTNKVRSQKFDIISRTPITVDEMWRAFLSTLEANDFTVVEVGRYYKIIQSTDGTRSPVEIYEGSAEHPSHDRVITKIWKLKYSPDINAVVNYLNIFKSGKGQIHPFARTNTIVATDYGTSIDRLERILGEIDQAGVLERVHIIDVEFATASEIAEKLTQVFEPAKAGGGKGAAKPASRVSLKSKTAKKAAKKAVEQTGESGEQAILSVSKIIPDDRTNKLIVIASDESLKQIMSLKRQLDTPTEGGEGLVHVVRLRHANAEDLASTLSSLASGKPTSSNPRRTARSKTKAATPAGAAALFQGDVKVTSDKPTNSLVVTASKSDFASMKRVIEKLDVARLQVYVEAVIMEVSVKRDRNLGLTWHGGIPATIDGQDAPIIFGNAHREFGSLTLTSNPISLASLLGFAGAIRGPPLEGTETIVQGGIPSIGVVIQALQSSNDVNVVSTPHIVTMDNEEAEIQVNERRPFPSGLSLGGLGALGGLAGQAGGAAGNLAGLGLGSVSFNREEIGLTLKLKPTINDQATVRLELDQELSDVAGTDAVTGQVVTSKRAAKTVVVVGDQESIIIGGLVRDRETTDESKVPLLGDLPLLGWLFKRQQRAVEKVNLVLVITPYIIRTPQDFRKIYKRKMEERREFVELFYGDTDEYRAAVDWERKRGPLAEYRKAIRDELRRPENEGPGTSDETVIRSEELMETETEGDAETPQIPETEAQETTN